MTTAAAEKTPEQIATEKAASDKAAADKSAADQAATDKAAADKAAADQAAADKAAADAASAGKTPEQLAAEKATADKAAADKAAADKAKAPETYTLELPKDGPLQHAADVLPLIAAEAKALGLSQEQAQQMVTVRSAAIAAVSAANLADAQADPEIGGDKFDTTVKHAVAGRDYLFPPDTDEGKAVTAWFDQTGLGNHKTFLRAMARIGKALAEDTPVVGKVGGKKTTKSREEAMFGDMPDNTPKP